VIAFVQTAASIGAALAGVAGALVAIGVIFRSPVGHALTRPLRWAWRALIREPVGWWWRKNISGPIGEWNRGIVGAVVDSRIEHLMHHRNDGSSLLDLADAVKKNQEGISLLDRKMSRSLMHDLERDQPGFRYGHIKGALDDDDDADEQSE